ncbi:MAG: hypothetical protein ACYCZY_09950 [Lacisediminihabitans sp.]
MIEFALPSSPSSTPPLIGWVRAPEALRAGFCRSESLLALTGEYVESLSEIDKRDLNARWLRWRMGHQLQPEVVSDDDGYPHYMELAAVAEVMNGYLRD